MSQQTTIFIIIAAGIFLVILLAIKNRRDRKKFIKPVDGSDSVSEENMEQNNQRDRL